jgi:hypothetical protein
VEGETRTCRVSDYNQEDAMLDKTKHIASAAKALAVFQDCCGTVDEHALANLVCDLGHLAEERDIDFVSEVERGIGHCFAEHHAPDGDDLGPNVSVEIIIKQK